MRYLLTNGSVTDKIEYYILDLFRLYFEVIPDEIPNSSIGFNKIFTNVSKSSISSEIKSRITDLINDFKLKFSGTEISLTNVEMIDEQTFRVEISVNSEEEIYEINSGLY